MLDAVRPGGREVDRLAALVGQEPQAGQRELDEPLRAVATRVPEEDRSRPEPPSCPEPLHEPLALESADET